MSLAISEKMSRFGLSAEETRQLYEACASSDENSIDRILRRMTQDDELIGWFFYLYRFLRTTFNDDVRRATYVIRQYGAHDEQRLLNLIDVNGQFLVPNDLEQLIERASSCKHFAELETSMSQLNVSG